MKKNHRIMTAALVIAGLLTIMTAGVADGTHARSGPYRSQYKYGRDDSPADRD